ncbi:Uncharacterized protein TCM_026735 [Theobroma cacao]|uniref:Uncharacterized protein n=1 Tax=Theobroma cacao TaxID=3641 RepID=A0A061FAV0_THECC|nr:Uncharacterized protein TCM_026735 [Theobroma cacao]
MANRRNQMSRASNRGDHWVQQELYLVLHKALWIWWNNSWVPGQASCCHVWVLSRVGCGVEDAGLAWVTNTPRVISCKGGYGWKMSLVICYNKLRNQRFNFGCS